MANSKAGISVEASGESSRLVDDINRRRMEPGNFSRGRVKHMREPISQLFARNGYAQATTSADIAGAWHDAVGETMASQSRVGKVRRGVLEVVVANSAVSQELTFRKVELAAELARRLPDHKIKSIRFRTGNVEHPADPRPLIPDP